MPSIYLMSYMGVCVCVCVCVCVYVRNIFSHCKGRTQIQDIWEQGLERRSGWKGEKDIESWRKYDKDLHNLYPWLNNIRILHHGRWDGQGMSNEWEKLLYTKFRS